jgi:hypothetical protein
VHLGQYQGVLPGREPYYSVSTQAISDDNGRWFRKRVKVLLQSWSHFGRPLMQSEVKEHSWPSGILNVRKKWLEHPATDYNNGLDLTAHGCTTPSSPHP